MKKTGNNHESKIVKAAAVQIISVLYCRQGTVLKKEVHK
jgi:hypothetical protein